MPKNAKAGLNSPRYIELYNVIYHCVSLKAKHMGSAFSSANVLNILSWRHSTGECNNFGRDKKKSVLLTHATVTYDAYERCRFAIPWHGTRYK